MKKNQNNSEISGLVLLKKHAGKTSFSSLSSVKRALNTRKVGHTGTLDSFADGLLVVLVGRLTHLVPHITNFDKTYQALIQFGSETDTLDPTGQVIKTGKIPSKEEVLAVLPKFTGQIGQIPPAYSALHVDGKRASDLVRQGKSVELKERQITISSIELLDFTGDQALIEVSCSKGTYIRSLARDIASACGTCAHLKELHRTRVGPFNLEDGVEDEDLEGIKNNLLPMNFQLAKMCGMDGAVLSTAFISDFNNGRPLKKRMFTRDLDSDFSKKEIAVFYPQGDFAGVITNTEVNGRKRLSYGFMISQKPKMKLYSWDQIVSGKFSQEFKDKGISLTIGSFDGSHAGHRSLFNAVLSKREEGLIPGLLTFTKSLRGMKNPDTYEGDVISLSQKIDSLSSFGFDFAIIVDFSDDFGKIKGSDFLSILVKNCGLKYLAEGSDFHCGYKGSTGMEEIKKISGEFAFSVDTIQSVVYEGERVSSSRIRNCILQKNFALANKLLFNPFEYDAAGLKWQRAGEKEIFTVLPRGVQLLPPSGTYKVMVSFYDFGQKSGEAQTIRAASSDCTLENGNLRLAFSDNLISGFVRSIQFF
ncbi:MAG: tRNA pseudouridine(55) synthase TruB [Treponema sp.]|nr:tRNA pseudouridine(55) synthase TruB [Treponema sp.]